MTIEAPDALPATGDPADRDRASSPAESTAAARPRAAPRVGRGRRVWRLGRWTLLLVLIGLNAWWYWRQAQPVVGLDTIAKWIEQHREGEAERALRQRLIRSPHDGESRVQLAKLLAQRQDLIGCARELHRVPFWWPEKGRWLV